MPKAREIMTKGAEHLEESESVQDAARKLATADVGSLPVCNTEGRLRGVVTDRDIVVKVIAKGRNPGSVTVGELADQDEVVTIGADDSLDEAVATMKDHKVRRLPVIDGDRLVGMVSQADLAGALPPEKLSDLLTSISA